MTADDAAPALREVVALLGDALATAPRRFGGLVALSIGSAVLESAALMLLPVVLGGPAVLPGLPALGPVALGAVYLALVGLAAAAIYGQATESDALIRRFGERLRTRLHEAVLGAAWGSPALAHPNELQHAIFAEAGQCAFAVRLGIDLVGRLVTLPALLVAALVLSPGFTLAVGAMALVLGLPTLRLARRAYRLSGTLGRENRALAATLADELSGLKPIKVLRAEPARGIAFAARLEALGRATGAQARATAGVRAWQRLATACAVAGGAGYGLAVMEIDGASMIALAVAALRLASGGMQAVETWRQLSRLLPIYEQVRRREADCLAVGEPAAAPTAPRLRRSLSFAAVAYAHPDAPTPTLSGIDLVLPAHGVTALVGPSGAGKSTLVDLAMGLIAPTAGAVAIDGAVLGAADRVAWRARVAYVPQDGFLFHDSIRANLAVAAPAADDAAMEGALRRAAADFVFALPDGLDTRVGDRGSRLSGGERQRIMIARALLQDADLVVFDESTSALDAATEAKVLAAVAELASRACVILVAHRPAAIALADRVVQIEAGRIVTIREARTSAAG